MANIAIIHTATRVVRRVRQEREALAVLGITDAPPSLALEEAIATVERAAIRAAKEKALLIPSRRLRTALRAGWRSQRDTFLRRLRGTRLLREAPELVPEDEALARGVWSAATHETLSLIERPLAAELARVMRLGWEAQRASLGVGAVFNLAHPSAIAFLSGKAHSSVEEVNDATFRMLRPILVQAVDEGWSYQQAAGLIRKKFAEFTEGVSLRHIRDRAELIAVTELGDAYEAGGMALVDDLAHAGVETEKYWLTVHDSRVSEMDHRNEQQGWLERTAIFSSKHSRPLSHPGCRCTLQYRRKKASDE